MTDDESDQWIVDAINERRSGAVVMTRARASVLVLLGMVLGLALASLTG